MNNGNKKDRIPKDVIEMGRRIYDEIYKRNKLEPLFYYKGESCAVFCWSLALTIYCYIRRNGYALDQIDCISLIDPKLNLWENIENICGILKINKKEDYWKGCEEYDLYKGIISYIEFCEEEGGDIENKLKDDKNFVAELKKYGLWEEFKEYIKGV